MDYLLDTNIIINLIRRSISANKLREDFNLFNSPNRLFYSIVSIGELESFALQKDWGAEKVNEIEYYSRKLITVDIRNQTILKRYAQIDAYSQGKLKGNPLNLSARNMGKNDLWIAACASVLNISLMTTDNDFDHLDGKFLKLIKV